MGRPRKEPKEIKPKRQFRCDVPGCVEADRDFLTVLGLNTHKKYKHSIDLKSIPPEGDSMSEEIKPIEQNNSTDLNAINEKLAKLTSMIPTNLCEEFPNLCKMKDHISGLEKKLDDVQSSIPKKITVNVPKQTTPEIPTPVVDVKSLSEELLKSITPHLHTDENKLGDLIKSGIDPISVQLQQLLNPKKEESVKIEETPVTVVKPEVAREDPDNSKTPVHKSAADFIECPECRQSLLDALQKHFVGNSTAEEVQNFFTKIKPLFNEEGNHHDHGHDRSDKNSTEPGTTRVEVSEEGEKSNSVQTTSSDEGISKPDSSKSDETCIGKWCLFRRKN